MSTRREQMREILNQPEPKGMRLLLRQDDDGARDAALQSAIGQLASTIGTALADLKRDSTSDNAELRAITALGAQMQSVVSAINALRSDMAKQKHPQVVVPAPQVTMDMTECVAEMRGVREEIARFRKQSAVGKEVVWQNGKPVGTKQKQVN